MVRFWRNAAQEAERIVTEFLGAVRRHVSGSVHATVHSIDYIRIRAKDRTRWTDGLVTELRK